ncbi:LysR family transcriptional regulator [Ruegeria sp. 2205SS24-7]|uniref:LysR family transcriptional regulator n=1 Tax=Ruegeria discodermiae TaxID=3064389 RepID=UPI00274161CC|nr:LysR family transcriptional regulator [Ruegeria sp. 2205SS24-7]MDP5217556.1 LysR family transcriptional regulator [Ruegeria sp. 2205SS24-7]
MQTNFRQYQAFHAIIDTGTVTGAAEQLGVSQPAISNLLAQLERRTKLRLFERSRGRLLPTPEAVVLFDEIDTIVRGLDHVNQAVVDLQNQKAGQLQVATSHAMAFGFMPGQIARFTADKPNLTIAFQSQYSSKIQEWVMAGLFEIGICELPVRHDGLHKLPFFFEIVCALPENSPLDEHDVLTPALLSDVPFIVMGADHMVNRRAREAFHSVGAHWRVRCQTDLFRNALNMVKEGLGATFVDPFTLSSDDGGGYVLRRFAPRILLDVVIVTARERPLSAIGSQFLTQISDSMATMAVE